MPLRGGSRHRKQSAWNKAVKNVYWKEIVPVAGRGKEQLYDASRVASIRYRKRR
jgi:hypothetical protein